MIDAKYKSEFYIDYTSDTTGPVVRWNSNDRIPFADMLQKFEGAGWIDGQIYVNSVEQRVIEDRIAIESYRKNYKGPSEEDLLEMRAEFGAGTKLVNILTGQEFTV
jgi:hypothetical protein